jgi:hypothetical protein
LSQTSYYNVFIPNSIGRALKKTLIRVRQETAISNLSQVRSGFSTIGDKQSSNKYYFLPGCSNHRPLLPTTFSYQDCWPRSENYLYYDWKFYSENMVKKTVHGARTSSRVHGSLLAGLRHRSWCRSSRVQNASGFHLI